MEESVRFTLNGKETSLTLDPDRKLLWVLRTDLGLTGTKFGCGESLCGACTVVVNDQAVRSCQTTMRDVRGKSVTTIEGLSHGEELHPIQKAFMDHDAFQCGYCTSGMIMNAYALLRSGSSPSMEQIVTGMEDNLCRCGAHHRILQAVAAAANATGGGL